MQAQRLRAILRLALPIIGGMTSQNILNLVDTAMVGTLGDAALAAVGLGGFTTFVCQAMVIGLSSGVQTIAARRQGEGRHEESAVPLNAGLLTAVAYGIPLGIALYLLIPNVFFYLNDDPSVVADGVPYLQWRVLAIWAVGMNFSFRGFWNATDRSGLYMRTLVFMHVVNVALNYVLIFGKLGVPAMGVAGAGLGTTLSTFLGTGYYFLLGHRHARAGGFLAARPTRRTVGSLLRLAVPNGVQQTLFAAGLTAMFWIIGQVGTTELAAASVLINLMLVAILPGLGLGMAATSLVGHALGRRDPADARQWAWDVVKVGFVALGGLGAVLALIPGVLLAGFIHDPETLAVARLPLVITGATMGIEAISLILMHALLGAGDQRRVMVASVVLQWGLFLPGAYVLGPVLGYGLLGIWILQAAQRGLQAGVFTLMWLGGRWERIRI